MMRNRFTTLATAFILGAGFVIATAADATTIDFESDTTGSKPNGFTSVDSGLVHFSDSAGSDLILNNFSPQSNGKGLGVFSDDPSFLIMTFDVPVSSLTLSFGNDDSCCSLAGDEAVLRLSLLGNPVTEIRVTMNRNDIIDQTIGYSGLIFDRAEFLYDVGTSGLIEIVDDITFEISTCGNNSIEMGEECDDGNTVAGDCCSSTCLFEEAASPCASDDEICTDDACDGAGACEHTNNTAACDDGQYCTVNDTCSGGSCGGTARECADTDACTADSCNEGADTCVNAQVPRDPASCHVGLKSKFLVKDSAIAGKDKLAWQWGAGEAFDQAALGTPLTSTTYTLCVYDETATVPSLAMSIDIAASPTLWLTRDPKGLGYKDKTGASEGVTRAQMKTGTDGKTKVKFSAGGMNLDLPAPAGSTFFNQDQSVVVQLVNSAGTCWTSEFTLGATKINGVDSFMAQVK